MNVLQISMLGTSFTIRSKLDEGYLKKLLDYYRQISALVAKGEPLSNLQNAILSGLMICDELYKEKSKKAVDRTADTEERLKEAENDARIESVTLSLIEKLDVALGDATPVDEAGARTEG